MDHKDRYVVINQLGMCKPHGGSSRCDASCANSAEGEERLQSQAFLLETVAGDSIADYPPSRSGLQGRLDRLNQLSAFRGIRAFEAGHDVSVAPH